MPPLDWVMVVLAGLAGTVGLTLLMLLATAAGVARLNFPMLLGSMFTRPGAAALGIGLLWHFANGVVFAALYALALGALAVEPSWSSGLALGAVHTVVAGLLVGLLGSVHPRIRQGQMPAPRFFGTRYGARGVLVLLVAHLVYGAIVGVIVMNVE
ncbi:MAG: hypothetical protein HY690_12215 [Chloroflexi bacterium]|nr:hypothetical protein [Chloroflexota bacterium]